MSAKINPKKFIKVLVIDADEVCRSQVREALEQRYLILEATNGVNGIDLAIDTEPDLVFIDIDLPDLSGFEVATRLKTLIPQTPVVAMAENALLGTRGFGLAVGFRGYIEKPIDPHALLPDAKNFFSGVHEEVVNKDEYLIAHQSELASRVEEKYATW